MLLLISFQLLLLLFISLSLVLVPLLEEVVDLVLHHLGASFAITLAVEVGVLVHVLSNVLDVVRVQVVVELYGFTSSFTAVKGFSTL